MSWHGPSAPRVEEIATKSRVVASCASKLASTASRIFCLVIFCLVSMAFISDCFPLRFQNREPANTVLGRDPRPMETQMPRNRNIRYLVIGALCGCALLEPATPVTAAQLSRERDSGGWGLGTRFKSDVGPGPAGQIKEVSGARMTAAGVVRAVTCVSRSGTRR